MGVFSKLLKIAAALVNLAVLSFFAIAKFGLLKVGLIKPEPRKTNIFLENNFAPVPDELRVNNLVVIEGELPSDLDGEFVRNGPNAHFKEELYDGYHWFDGDGMLHAVRVENGTASYVNRYVQTARFKQEAEVGHPIYPTLGKIKDPLAFLAFILERILGEVGLVRKLTGQGTANTALTYHDGRLLALVENDAPTAIKLPNLETLGLHTYNNTLHFPFTAHPKIDPVTNECIFFGYRFEKKPYVHYGIVDAKGNLSHTLPIDDVDVAVMMHDFAITENYSIIMNLPLTFRLERLLNGENVFQFETNRKSKFGIFPRHTTNQKDIVWFESDSCFIFHTASAWEQGDEVVLIACRSKETSGLGMSSDENEWATNPNYKIVLYEWRFNLKSRGVKERELDNERIEFPTINEQVLGRRPKFIYAAKLNDDPTLVIEGLIKYELHDDGSISKSMLLFGVKKHGGESIFVPRKNAATEDDGYLMTFVYDCATNNSEYWVINATNLQKIARIQLPRRIPYGFHGKWVTAEQIKNQKPLPTVTN